jgi:hypothetical protein
MHQRRTSSPIMWRLQRGLAELGYIAGRQVLFVTRNAGTQMSRLPELADELVRSRIDVLVTSTTPTTLAARNATTIIPIVMTVGVDPVDAGLVASLARPGANVTGVTFDVDAEQHKLGITTVSVQLAKDGDLDRAFTEIRRARRCRHGVVGSARGRAPRGNYDNGGSIPNTGDLRPT